MRSADVIVIGGGVAGLAAAAWLAPKQRVVLLERDDALAGRASGNSAAIFRTLEADAASAALPRRSRELLAEEFRPGLLEPTGLLLVSDQAGVLGALAREANMAGVAHARLEGRQLAELAPSLAGGCSREGLLLRDSGVLDAPALMRELAQRARAHGAELRTGSASARIERERDRVTGVLLADSGRIAAGHVIVAAGAWSAEIGGAAGAALPLSPMRRHLIELRCSGVEAVREPVVWRLDDEVYFRRATGVVLASPCDELRSSPSALALDPNAELELARKLSRLAPGFARAPTQRVWPCLRTFASDRELVLGEDPRVRGLHWFSGLGGRGMSVALAAAELLAESVLEPTRTPLSPSVLPARLL